MIIGLKESAQLYVAGSSFIIALLINAWFGINVNEKTPKFIKDRWDRK